MSVNILCPACEFEIDRSANAAINILSRGVERVGLGQSKETTPVETALRIFASSGTSDVVETGNPTLKEATPATECDALVHKRANNNIDFSLSDLTQ